MDLENFSDLDNLLAIAEEEFYCKESENIKLDSDCQIVSVNNNNSDGIGIPLLSSIRSFTTASLSIAKTRVQSSISHFFKPPKRFPDEIIVVDSVEDDAEDPNWKRVKSGTPFVFPPGKSVSTSGNATTTVEIGTRPQKYKLPRFKLIPGTPFSVDAFSYGPLDGVSGYFLTHFHSDHYKGLTNKLFNGNAGRIYCSEVTGNLVRKELKIRGEIVTTLKVGQIYQIEGIQVGVLDANQ